MGGTGSERRENQLEGFAPLRIDRDGKVRRLIEGVNKQSF
jgi:hypothetical protein